MIRFFRSYRKTVFGILIFFAAALLMTSFGVDFQHMNTPNNQQAAVKIGDTTVSHREYFERRREAESRYRQMFGPRYDELSKQFGLNVPQQVLDSIVAETVVVKDITARGFAASDQKVIEMIKAQFPGGYDPNALRGSGKTPQQFLHDTTENALKAQYQEILQDVSLSSKKEAEALYVRKETLLDVQVAEFSAKDFIKDVTEPTAEQLQSYYDDHKDDFQLPARASYEYVTFSPDQFLDQIDVAQDEVDFYYTDNQSQFEKPEELKIRHIQLLFPKETDPKKLSAVKDKALEAYDKAKAGESFTSLVNRYSDDLTSRSSGGDLGWVPRGRYSPEFDTKTYAVKDGGLAELIETEYGYHIVKVEGHHDSELKPLEAVRSDIQLILKKDQAPAYADTKAREFFDAVSGSDEPLSELAKRSNFTVHQTSGLLSASQDPSSELTGLTGKILENSFEPKQVIDLKDKTIVVSLKEAKEPEVPALDSIKQPLLQAYKTSQSITLAQARSKEILDAAAKEPQKPLSDMTKGKNFTVQKEAGLNLTKQVPGALSNPSVREKLFNVSAPATVLPEVFSQQGNFYVVQVTGVTKADPAKASTTLLTLRDENSGQLGDIMTNAVVEHLKSQAEITIDNSVLVNES